MNVHVEVLNRSTVPRAYRRDVLQRLAQRICEGEGVRKDAELSVLFCDDPCIQELNSTYRKKDVPTDVLSFTQEGPAHPGPRVLGDIVISLETVVRNTGGDPAAVRAEVRLLFSHGLLHLLGYVHDTDAKRKAMTEKQSEYLGCTKEAAWHSGPDASGAPGGTR